MNILVNLVRGVVMGMAEIVPGISASTATLLLGIYDDFITLLHNGTLFLRDLIRFVGHKLDFRELKNSFIRINPVFAIELFAGMVIGIVLFSNIVDYLFEQHENYVQAIFFGIILASLLIPFKIVKTPKATDIGLIIFGFLVFYLFLNLGTHDSSDLPIWLIFVGGAISVTGMVLPGVNSSFLLIPLGIYEFILNMIAEFSKFNFQAELIWQGLVFFAGIVTGLVSIVKVLRLALVKHLTGLMSLIAGFMLASLIALWPFNSVPSGDSMVLSGLLVIFTIILTTLFIIKTKPEQELLDFKNKERN